MTRKTQLKTVLVTFSDCDILPFLSNSLPHCRNAVSAVVGAFSFDGIIVTVAGTENRAVSLVGGSKASPNATVAIAMHKPGNIERIS